MAAIVLSSLQACSGKSTLCAAIAAALRLHGCKVSRFSVGPGLSEQPPQPQAAGQQLPSDPAGLDGWLLSQDAVAACFYSMSSTADLSLVEGCAGMFDSPAADGSEAGSTAQVAAWLHLPVVLVVDAQAFHTPRSILALVRGYAAEDGSTRVAGLILNKALKQGLAAETQDALRQAGLDVAVLGSLPLVQVATAAVQDSSSSSQAQQQELLQERVMQLVCDTLDLQLLRQLAAAASVPQPQAPLPPAARTFRVSLGVAYDEAFYRYFQENLHLLQLAGVQLVPFSPLHDRQLPPGLSGVLLGGGAVAQHAAQLSANSPMLEALRAFAGAGGLVIGEAGGLLYLSQSLQWQQHRQRHAMVGLFSFHTQATPHKGPHNPSYVSLTVSHQAQHPLLIPGSSMRGLATCCCQVLEERPVGSLAAALAAATADAAAPQQQQQQQTGNADHQGRISSSGGSSSTSSDRGSTAGDGPQQQQQQLEQQSRVASDYTYSYSCTPLAASSKGAAATVAPAAVPAIEEGYTRGTVLASAVQVHYGSCPELAQHMAQRCLRVDVATVTAAAKSAAAAAAAWTGGPRQPLASLLLPDACERHDSNDTHGSVDAADGRQPSPGSRALSAPNLQDMVWHQLQSGSTPAAGPTAAAVAAAAAGAGVSAVTPPGGADCSSSSSVGGAWFCPTNDPAGAAAAAAGPHGEEVSSASAVGPGGPLSPARKSSSVPSEMWQMAGAEQRQQQQHHQYLPYARYQQHLQQPPLGFRVGSCPTGAQGQAGAGAGPAGMLRQGPASEHGSSGQQQQPGQQRWGPPAFNVPKRWSMELQRLGSNLTSQLLQGGYRSDSGSPRSVTAAAAQQQQQQPASQSSQSQHQRSHSRNNSRSMMHLPEEAPLSEAAIRILDSSLPALLGRTHHTHIGVAVPLSSGAGSAAGSAACSTGGTGPGAGSVGLQTGGTLDSMSRSSSVHEQISNLAASLALQEAAGRLVGGSGVQPLLPPGSCTDRDSVCTSACPEQQQLMTPDQQLMLQQVQGWGLGQQHLAAAQQQQQQQQQVFSLEALTAAHQQSQQQQVAVPTARSRSSSSRLSSVDTPTAFAAATAALDDEFAALNMRQQQQGHVGPHDSVALLQPEVSLKAGLGTSSQQQQQQQFGPRVASLGELAAAGAAAAAAAGAGLKLPPKKASTSSSSLSGMWAGGGTPKAAAAAAVAAAAAAGAAAQRSGLGSIMSLSPAATDILIALGLYQRVTGVTDACRPCAHGSGSSGGGSGAGGGGSSSSGASSSCWQVLQLLEAMGAPWVTEAVEAATGSSRGPDVVCRLVAGADGLPRYKLDEDCIRSLQPSLVVVACDENSGEEPPPHCPQLQKARSGAAGLAGALAATAVQGVGGSSSIAVGSSLTAAVAVPGRVRLEPHVVQRVLQRAGVWGVGRAVVLYQRCHSLAEVLEFMQVLAQAAGVPERGALLVEGLRARLRATAARVCWASEGLARSSAAAAGPGGGRAAAASAGDVEPEAGAGALVGSSGSGSSMVAGPSVMVLGCTAPLSLVGFWVPEMLQLLGLEPPTLGPAPGEAPTELTWSQLREAGPDVLVLALPGLPAAQAALHLADLASLPRFWALPAVRAGAVYAVDHALLLRPGPSLVLGLELLSHLAAPEQQMLPSGLSMGSVLKLSLHGGQRCRPRLVPHYMARYC